MRKRKNTRNPSKKIRLYSVFPVFFGIFVFLILIALAAFSTTSLSGYNMENSSIKIMNLKSFPVVGGDWKVNFTTIGKSNLTISSINGTHFGTDISLQSVSCGNSSIHFSWLNSDTAFIPDYSCNVASTETSRELISGNHTIQFDFGGNLAEAHNYAQRLNWVVQSGETTMNAQTTVVNIPTPVNTSRAFILYSVRASTTYDDPSHSGIYLQWVNGTRFNLIQGSASSFGAIVDWYVIEGGSIKVQSGVQSYTTTSTSFNIPITSINTSRSAVFMGLGSCASTTNTYLGQTRWTGSLTSSTNLYIQRDYSGNCAGSVSYFVVEFDDGSKIQNGAISNVGSSSYAYVNPVNLSNTWFYFSSAFGSTATRAEDQGIIFRFYNSTAFQLSRNSGARSTARVQWYAISTPGSVVQKGATNLGSSTSVNVPISSVVTNRSLSFASFNQTSTSTAPTYMLLSSRITSTTNLNIQRGTSTGTEYSGWEAVKLPYNPPSVTWNMSSLSLGSQPIENGNLTGTAQIYSFLTNNNTQVSCTSGSCSYITDDFTTSNLVDMQYSNVHFTCSNTTVGHLSALFSVTSTQDTSPNYINVSCGFTDIHPPTGSLISPTNDSYLNSRTQNLTAVISDNYALSSAKLLIYNSSNSLINSTLKLISGKSYTLGIIYHFPYDGVFRWSYRLNDTSGNTYSILNNTLIIDTTNPLLSYSSGTATNDTNTTRKYVYVNVSFSDINFANVTYSLYDGNMNPVNITTYNSQIKYINWTGLSDGTYYYNVQVYDLADNSNTTQTRKITIDTTAPVINILSPKPRQYLTNISLPLNVSVTDAGVGVSKCWWNLDNHPNQTILCNENTTFNTSVGTHTLYFYSNDSLGNLAESSVTFDTSAGGVAVQLLTPITDAYLSYKKNINFSFIPKSAFLISSCSLYGNWSGSWKINQTHHSLQNWSMDSFLVNFSSDGSYLWNVWCNDTSGKSNFNLVNKTFTIDTINPLISYGAGAYPNDTYLNSTSIFVNTSVIELNFANITFSLYNGTGTNLYSDTFTDSTRSDTWNYLPEGVYYYNVTVYDRAGNKNSTSTRKITLDTTAPNANLITPLNDTRSNNRNQNLSFNATDNIALKNATLNVYNSSGKLINTTTILISGTKVVGGIVYEFLYDGVFNWFYRVFDMAGNVVLTSNNTLSIDSIAPSLSYSTGTPSNNSKFQGNWIYVNTSASDLHFSNITFDLYNSSGLVNETTYAGNSVTSINWTNLASGNVTYRYNVTAEDTYNNFNHTFTRTIELIDTIPPYVHIITPKNETYSTNVSLPLSFTATDLNLKSCWYNIDHSANITIPCNQGTTFSTSDFQEHTLYLYANDTLGNINSTKVSFLVNTSYIPTSTYNVQRGSVSVNGNSIVPINEMDPSKSFIILDAVSSSSAPSALQVTGNFSDPNDLSFYNYAGGAATVQWEAITGPYIKAQRGENSYTSTASSITIPISAVNLSSSFIIVYNRLNSGTSNQYISGLWTGHFVNSTAIQVQRTTTGNAGVVSWQVVSWKGASVQSGATILGSTATTNTSSLATSVNKSESFLIFSGTEGSSTGIAYWNVNGALSSNSITFTRSTASGTYTANWFAVSGNMFDVNNGSVSMTSSTTTTIPQLANVSKSFRWQSHTSTGTGNTNANGIVSSAITGATTLALYKGTTSQTNIVQWQTVEIVDRTPPSGTILSPKNNTYTNRTSQNFVLNATDNLQLGNATLNIYNSSGKLINTTTILLSGTNDVASVVYEFLYDGVFHWFYRIFDAAGNSFNTTNSTLTIDTINPLISYSAGTYSNNTYTNKKYIYVNVTSYDLNFANLTFYLYNSTGLVNKTTYNLENTKINWTNLADGIYYYNATAGDLAGNFNSTKTRKVTVDTTDPLVSYSSGTLSNGTYVNSTSIFVNTSVTELNFANITFNLYNSTQSKIYSNLYTNGTRSQKWSSLPQGSYYYNVTVYDLAGNKNSTLTRKITLDTTAPNASLMTPANDTYSKSKNQNLSFNATDNIALKNATLNVYNSSGKLINTTTILTSGTKVVGGIVYEFLYDGVFNWFYRVFDLAGNVVLTSNNTITIDTTSPLISFGQGAHSNNSYINKHDIYTNLSIHEINFANVTFYLYNSTGLVNETTYNSLITSINWTGLSDGTYYYNATARDLAGNSNSTGTRKIIIDTIPPVVNLGSPMNNSGYGSSHVIFYYNATDSSPLQNCTLIFNGKANQTNSSVAKNVSQNFQLNALAGFYNWSIECYDLAGNNRISPLRYFTVIPAETFNGATTDFSKVNVSYIFPLVIENTSAGKINYSVPVNLSGGADLNSLVKIYKNNITVNSALEPRLNKSATVNLYNLTFKETPIVIENGKLCLSPQCNVISYSAGNFTFDVSHFTSYSAGSNSQLITYDSTDPLGGSKTKYVHNQINFFANYTNRTSLSPVAGSGIFCNISFNVSGGWTPYSAMIFNSSSSLYESNRSFSSNGTFNWNVTCDGSSSGYEPLNTTNTVKVTLDTVPPKISFSSGTAANNSYLSKNWIYANLSLIEDDLSNVTFYLYNSTGLVNKTVYNFLVTHINWTGLSDDTYYYNATAFDLGNNENSTKTRWITLDTHSPNATLVLPLNDTYSKSKNQNLSFNATDNIALKNATLNVYNSSGKLINTTTILISGTKVVGGIVYEFLYDGVFNWFYRVFDMAGNVVLTSNNTITIDTTPPSVTLNSPANNSLSTKIVHLSANFNDANNLSNATLYLWNSTGKIVNKMTVTLSGKSGSANISINLSYYDTFRWNYASCDFLGNCNFGVSNRTIKYEKPSLGLSLVYPKSSITVGQNKFFNVTLNVSCLSGICGTSNISLDPSNWWNNNWLYRRTINLTGAGKILTNYQVLVNLNLTSAYKNGKLNSDCSDIRFVNSSGSSLNYWIQSCNIAGGNSSFWVKVPIISASGVTPITMYYGNPLASSISNGTKTFNYYGTANSTSGWTIVGAAGSTSAQGLPPPSYYANSASGDYMYTNASLKPNETISFNVRSNGLGNLFFLTGATGQGQMFRAETRAGNNAGLGNTASWTSWSVPSSTCSNIATNTWYNFTVNIGATTAQAYVNGVACGSPFTYTNRGPYMGLIGDGLGATYTTWWDNIIVRQYSATVPTVTLGSEQAAVKSGLVSTHTGDVPFYTNASNPRTTISLSKGQSQKVTFWVNATGVGTNTFFAYANLTSNLSISNMTKSWNVTIDNVPPKVTVISPSNRTYNLSNINFSVSGNENLSLCNFSFNNFVTNYKMSEVNSTVFSKLNFHIADGRYTAKFLCEDLAGNVNSSAKVSFTVDAFGANASLISPKNNTYSNKTTQNFTLSANDSVGLGEAIFNLYNSTGSLINTTTIVLSGTKDIVGVVYEFLYDGIFHWFYRVVDSGGHVTNTQNRTIIIDNVTPLISFSSGTLANNTNASHNWIYANVSVTEVNPGNLTFYLYNGTGGTHLVNKTSYIGLSKKYINWTKLADGVYYYKASETDLAGNYNVTSMRKIRLDTHAPVIITTFPVNNFAYGYNITHLNYTISDPLISQCWYNLNQTANITIPCGSTGVSVFLSDGHYNWTIYANDTLGHLSYKMVSFLVDTHLPSVKIFYPQNLTYAHNVTQMNFSATAQSLDSCWYSLNGGATNITTSCNQNLTGLTSHEGQNDWRVYANNSAGGQAYAFVYFTVDTTPPHLTVSSPVTKTYYPSKINFNISGNENLGGCNLSINSWMTNYTMDKLSSTSFGYSFSPAPGTYTAKFSCNDTAGNINSSLSVPFNVSYPTILLNVTYPLKNENILHNSKFNFSVNVTCLVSDCGQVNVTLDPSTNWWNRDWEFRQRFNLSVPSGSTPAGYQTKIILNSSNVGSDFSWSSECVNSNSSRIRFVNSYQNSTLPYWVQSCSVSGHNMTVWVKLDKILNPTGYSIYLYYGNPSATTYSNGTGTFEYFDTGNNVSSWTIVGSAGQTATTGNPTPSYYAVSQNGNYMYKNINLKPNETIMFDSMSNGLGNLFFLTNAAGAGQMFRTETRSGQSAGLTSTTSWTAWTAPTACSALSTNTWYNIQINLGSTTAQSYVNGISCGGAYTFTNNGGYIGLVGDALGSAYTTWWDNLIVRKYSSVTPSYNTGAEEIIPKTIISTSVGAKPFYANANPILTNSLNVSQSQLLTFFVNATGYPETYKFFAFGNLTKNQSVSNISNARNITIITVAPPTIKLIYPSKNAKFSNHTASKFSFSVSDSSFSTCQLWGNWSGSWAINQTLLSVPANVTTNFAGINFSNDGVYKWNVRCNDGYGDYAWNSTNYTFAAYFPPTKPLLVNITQTKTNGKGNITIYWSKTNHTTYYNIYYSPNMQGPFISLANTTKTNYTDKTFSGKLSRFYFVKSANPVSGNSSSKYFGAIVYTLSHTTGTSNLIGFPVNFSYLTNANKTLYSITNTTSFNLWNATIQKRVTCNKFSCPSYPSCTGTNCNFNLNTGQGYEVNINSSAPGSVNWSGVGIVNSPVNVHLVKNSTSFGENWISIYANTTLSNAKALLTGISISDTVSRWNPLTQSSQGYLHLVGPIYLGTNFPIKITEGYEVSVVSTGNWTQV